MFCCCLNAFPLPPFSFVSILSLSCHWMNKCAEAGVFFYFPWEETCEWKGGANEMNGGQGEAGTSRGWGQVWEVDEGSLVAATCLSACFTVAGYLLVSVVVWWPLTLELACFSGSVSFNYRATQLDSLHSLWSSTAPGRMGRQMHVITHTHTHTDTQMHRQKGSRISVLSILVESVRTF